MESVSCIAKQNNVSRETNVEFWSTAVTRPAQSHGTEQVRRKSSLSQSQNGFGPRWEMFKPGLTGQCAGVEREFRGKRQAVKRGWEQNQSMPDRTGENARSSHIH